MTTSARHRARYRPHAFLRCLVRLGLIAFLPVHGAALAVSPADDRPQHGGPLGVGVAARVPLTAAEAAALGCAALASGSSGNSPSQQPGPDAKAAQRWEWQLAREDHHLLEQARLLGCSGACREQVERALAARAKARKETIALSLSGRIDREAAGARAAASGQDFRRSLRQALGPQAFARIDEDAARADTVRDAAACDAWLSK